MTASQQMYRVYVIIVELGKAKRCFLLLRDHKEKQKLTFDTHLIPEAVTLNLSVRLIQWFVKPKAYIYKANAITIQVVVVHFHPPCLLRTVAKNSLIVIATRIWLSRGINSVGISAYISSLGSHHDSCK